MSIILARLSDRLPFLLTFKNRNNRNDAQGFEQLQIYHIDKNRLWCRIHIGCKKNAYKINCLFPIISRILWLRLPPTVLKLRHTVGLEKQVSFFFFKTSQFSLKIRYSFPIHYFTIYIHYGGRMNFDVEINYNFWNIG